MEDICLNGGQVYRLLMEFDDLDEKGGLRRWAWWRTLCPTCGQAFDFRAWADQEYLTRRCPDHAKPGRRVFRKAGPPVPLEEVIEALED